MKNSSLGVKSGGESGAEPGSYEGQKLQPSEEQAFACLDLEPLNHRALRKGNPLGRYRVGLGPQRVQTWGLL